MKKISMLLVALLLTIGVHSVQASDEVTGLKGQDTRIIGNEPEIGSPVEIIGLVGQDATGVMGSEKAHVHELNGMDIVEGRLVKVAGDNEDLAKDELMISSTMLGICRRSEDYFRPKTGDNVLIFIWGIQLVSENSIGQRYIAEALINRDDNISVWHAEYLCADSKEWLRKKGN